MLLLAGNLSRTEVDVDETAKNTKYVDGPTCLQSKKNVNVVDGGNPNTKSTTCQVTAHEFQASLLPSCSRKPWLPRLVIFSYELSLLY